MEGKYFVLVSKHCNLTLGIQDNSNQEGTLAVLCNKNEYEPHQVWYEEVATGTIRSKANDLCLTVTGWSRSFYMMHFKLGESSFGKVSANLYFVLKIYEVNVVL